MRSHHIRLRQCSNRSTVVAWQTPIGGRLAHLAYTAIDWSSACLAGVSDGVGGWSLSGVDAGEYSRLLMIMSKLFSESARTPPTPSQIMHSAYNQTQARRCPMT